MNRSFLAWNLVCLCAGMALPPIVAAQVASDAEAKVQIDIFWRRKITRCGADSYIAYDNGEFKQLKNGTWTVRSRQLNQAEIMNGLQWHGSTELQASQSRLYLPQKGGWQPWEQGRGFGVFGVEVTKRSGSWNFTPSGYSAINDMSAPQCSRIPRDLTAQEIQQAQAAQQSQACRDALEGKAINAAPVYVESATDPGSCVDADGRNLLMLLPIKAGHGWDLQVHELIKSGKFDLNTKDRFGYPALAYLLIRMKKGGGLGFMARREEIVNTMINRVADKVFLGADGTTLDWSKVPTDFPSAAQTLAADPSQRSTRVSSDSSPLGGKFLGQIKDPTGTYAITLDLSENGRGTGALIAPTALNANRAFGLVAKLQILEKSVSGTLGYTYKEPPLGTVCTATMVISAKPDGNARWSGTFTSATSCSAQKETGTIWFQRN